MGRNNPNKPSLWVGCQLGYNLLSPKDDNRQDATYHVVSILAIMFPDNRQDTTYHEVRMTTMLLSKFPSIRGALISPFLALGAQQEGSATLSVLDQRGIPSTRGKCYT